MKQYIVYLLFCSVALIFFSGFSQQSNTADELLRSSISYTISLKDFEADFSYSLSTVNRVLASKKGNIRYKAGKYLIFTEDSHLYFDNQNHWVYLPKYNQFMEMDLSPYQVKGVLYHMHSAFTSPTANREYLGMEQAEGINSHKISIEINDGSLDYKKGILWLNEKSLFPVKASFFQNNGTKTTYKFTHLRPNIGLSLESFTFKPSRYPDAEKVEGEHDE